jgi:subtilisin family serine protease
LNTSTSLAADTPRVAVSVAAGNEGGLNRHFYSELDSGADSIQVELNIGENESGFTMEFWGDPPMIYTMNIRSPSGETQDVNTNRLMETQTIRFIFDMTIIYINYVLIEQITGKQVIILRFNKPFSGIWVFQVFGKGDIKGAFHIWLPMNDFITKNTYFLNANPFTTITSPGNCIVPITVTAYNSSSNILYSGAGRGFSTSNIINPELAAPGVNIQAPSLGHGFKSLTGTSAAAAHTTGITALLLEWCVVNNNYPDVDTVSLKKFLIRGAKRSSILKYPNPDWGYGIIDVYNTFNVFRTL